MAVEIKYVVVRAGEEKMTFISKKEADAYDKFLDRVDELAEFIEGAGVDLAPEQTEVLALYLAEHKELLLDILRGKKGSGAPTEQE